MPDGEAPEREVPFEDVVAALLNLDPTAITGQRAANGKDATPTPKKR
jgi:hypothetical protein